MPKEVDIEDCIHKFEANNSMFLNMIEGKAHNIAMVYSDDESGDCDLCPAAKGVMYLFYIVWPSTKIDMRGKFSAKLLVEEEQANVFFQTQAESIEKTLDCTFVVHEADGIGLLRDLILEIIGEVDNLRCALMETTRFFQKFSVHKSMIPLIAALLKQMNGPHMENMPIEMSVDSHALSEPLKVVVEYCTQLYYVSIGLVGENGSTLRKLRNDSRATIILKEVKRDPRWMTICIIGKENDVRAAEVMVKNLLNEAVTSASDMLHVSKLFYVGKS